MSLSLLQYFFLHGNSPIATGPDVYLWLQRPSVCPNPQKLPSGAPVTELVQVISQMAWRKPHSCLLSWHFHLASRCRTIWYRLFFPKSYSYRVASTSAKTVAPHHMRKWARHCLLDRALSHKNRSQSFFCRSIFTQWSCCYLSLTGFVYLVP